MSQILPNTRMSPAITRKYTVTTHEVSPVPMPKDSAMSGRATFTMVPSNPSRNMLMAMVASNSPYPLCFMAMA